MRRLHRAAVAILASLLLRTSAGSEKAGAVQACNGATSGKTDRSLVCDGPGEVLLQAFAAPAPSLLAAAPNPNLVKEAMAKKKAVQDAKSALSGHYTQRGCHCLQKWTYKGAPQAGCSKEVADFSNGHHFCQVSDLLCESAQGKLPDGGQWDYCFLDSDLDHTRTIHGCHCAPAWEYKGKAFNSCSRTSKGPMWCYVFEGGGLCPDALRTEHNGQHWDYCFVEDQTSPYLTRTGCHCMPEWENGGEMYKGCAIIKQGQSPSCKVLEDTETCPMGRHEGNAIVDECTVVEGSEEPILAELRPTGREGCHCQPLWTHLGQTYRGCASTPDRQKEWCYIVEDQRLCELVEGVGQGKEALQRWRYCEEQEPSPAAPSGNTTIERHHATEKPPERASAVRGQAAALAAAGCLASLLL